MPESLPRAMAVVPAGGWPEAEARDSVVIQYDDRHRRRRVYAGERGFRFLLDLPEALMLREGDGLALEGGGYVTVRAAPEPLIEVTAGSADALAQLAWHIGNRHLPAEIGRGRILIRDDHVIAAMLQGLGASLRPVTAPFNPGGGAYGDPVAAGHHGHDHGHHGHEQGHAHYHHAEDHAHGHEHGHDHAHSHDPAPGHARHPHAHDHGSG